MNCAAAHKADVFATHTDGDAAEVVSIFQQLVLEQVLEANFGQQVKLTFNRFDLR